MTQYIDKAAIVAEINKRIIDAPINNIWHQRVWAYNDVKDIIETLEVKEVDLEKEIAEPVREEAILRRAIEVYGCHAQINMALEEMGELIVALQRWLRGRVSYVEVCEEVADVQIMMKQLAMIFDKDIVRKYYESKIKRLEQRLNKED